MKALKFVLSYFCPHSLFAFLLWVSIRSPIATAAVHFQSHLTQKISHVWRNAGRLCHLMWGWPLAVAHRTRRGAFWAACTYMRVWIGPHESSSVSFWLSALCWSRGTDFEYYLAEGEKRQASWIAQTKNRRRSFPLPPSMRKLQNTGSMTLLVFYKE